MKIIIGIGKKQTARGHIKLEMGQQAQEWQILCKTQRNHDVQPQVTIIIRRNLEMATKKKVIIFLFMVIGLIATFISLLMKGKEKERIIIKVEGFEIERDLECGNIKAEDIDDIKLGSSMCEITNKLGEPDTWIGSGMLRPVYFLEDNKVVVFHFEYPSACEDLKQVVLIRENGESQIIKEK